MINERKEAAEKRVKSWLEHPSDKVFEGDCKHAAILAKFIMNSLGHSVRLVERLYPGRLAGHIVMYIINNDGNPVWVDFAGFNSLDKSDQSPLPPCSPNDNCMPPPAPEPYPIPNPKPSPCPTCIPYPIPEPEPTAPFLSYLLTTIMILGMNYVTNKLVSILKENEIAKAHIV